MDGQDGKAAAPGPVQPGPLPFKAPPLRPPPQRPHPPGEVQADGVAAPKPGDATDLDALLLQPPAKRARGEESNAKGAGDDPAAEQGAADGSLPPLPKPIGGAGGKAPAKVSAWGTLPGKEAAEGGKAPAKVSAWGPPPGQEAAEGNGSLMPMPKVSAFATDPTQTSAEMGSAPPLQPMVVSPPPKLVPFQSSGGWTATDGGASRVGVLAPKMQSGGMGGIQSKTGQAKQPPAISSKGVTVPPPPHLQQRQQWEEDRTSWQSNSWQKQQEELRQQQEEQRKAWEEEVRRQEEEKARLLREEQDREETRRQEIEAVALQLHGELAPLLDAAEERLEKGKEMAESIDVKHGKPDDEVIKIADEFEVLAMTARSSVKACSDFMSGKYLKLQGMKESTRQEAAMFLKRYKVAEREGESLVLRVRARKREALISRDKEQKRQAALRAAEKQESLFAKYDADGDGVLSAHEVGAFVKGECNFDLPKEKVESILQSEAFTGTPGVPRERFAQLRLLVGVAAVVGALSGMEAEVAKAEEKAKPLTVRGRQVPLEALEERTDEVDGAVDAARDYLAAAREQVQGLDVEQQSGTIAPTAVRMAIAEARKLGSRLDWFEQRLARAAAASKASRDRLVLQQKKEALMRQADLAAMRAM